MNENNIVKLNFKGSSVQEEYVSFHACAVCKNKTYTLTCDGQDYPLMKCAACGNHIGRMGWVEGEIGA